MKRKNELRYIVTDIVSIPVCRLWSKGETYRAATAPGWGTVELYSAVNSYNFPVSRDREDKTQELLCDEDSSAILFPKYGREFVIAPCETINLKDAPRQSEVDAIILSNAGGFEFWEQEEGDIKIFATYDENRLIDSYRLDNWSGEPYDGETEITFNSLINEDEHDKMDRADIPGTFENMKRMSASDSKI